VAYAVDVEGAPMTTTGPEVIGQNPAHKYEGEASAVTELLQHHAFDEVQRRLQIDSQLQPHELDAFLTQMRKDVAASGLNDVQIVDDFKKGMKVTVTDEDDTKRTLLDISPESLASASDERVPRIGDFFTNPAYVYPPIKKEDVDAAFKHQQDLAAQGIPRDRIPRIGQILKESKYGGYSQRQIDEGIEAQDEAKAHQIADDLGRGMPILPGEGYFQMLKRSYPELADEDAAKLAHRVRQINDGRINLSVGEQLAVLSPSEKAALHSRVRSALDSQELGR
jgi:hypothetical protein